MRLGLAETFAAAALLAVAVASPAQAQMPPPPPMMHGSMGPMGPMHGGPVYGDQVYGGGWAPPMVSPGAYQDQRAEWDAQRADWLDECRYNHRERRHRGLLGAVLGGVVGGVVGHEIAGRDDHVLGTVAGAAVGALAGSAIERASDHRRASDWCESYLDYYATPQTQMTMVPMPAPQREPCVETVTETIEYVDGPRHRYIPPRPHRVIHDKRILISPDKRVRM